MLQIIIIALLAAAAGIAKAVQDKITHHFETSIFARYNPRYWNSNISWKNKYRDWDGGDRRRRWWMPVSLTDAWHLFDNLRTGFLFAAVLYASATGDIASLRQLAALALALGLGFYPAFHLSYTYFFDTRK